MARFSGASPADVLQPIARFISRHPVLVAGLAVHALIISLVNTAVSPHPDVIDHWMQSRMLSWSYYEHPPMIAWWIRLFTSVLGESESTLKFAAWVTNALIMAGAYALTLRLFGSLAAVFTLVLLWATQFFTLGTLVLNIDSVMLLCWLGALACWMKYLETNNPRWLLWMGVAGGLGGLSKYVMVLFYLGVAVTCAMVPSLRREFKNPYQYAGGAIALAVFSPVLFWNATHDWVSFRHQLAKGGVDTHVPFGKHLLEFTVGWWLLFSVVLSVWAIAEAAGWIRRAHPRGRVEPETALAWMGLTPLVFFSIAFILGSFPDPKYADTAFLTLFILLGHSAALAWQQRGQVMVTWMVGSAWLINLALGLMVLVHTLRPFLPIPAQADNSQQVVGWHETGQAVADHLINQGVPLPQYVVSYFYPLASQLALHLPRHPLAFSHSLERPLRNLWSPDQALTTNNTLFFCEQPEKDCRWIAGYAAERGWKLVSLGRVTEGRGGPLRHPIEIYRPMP
ncbi:MAG: glycosyltransferase family 39 protein [Deltaproteobacteria bacterium]|nr:glycosyltransferase family 39 protein [Deltaproteobacteria bacterium]